MFLAGGRVDQKLRPVTNMTFQDLMKHLTHDHDPLTHDHDSLTRRLVDPRHVTH